MHETARRLAALTFVAGLIASAGCGKSPGATAVLETDAAVPYVAVAVADVVGPVKPCPDGQAHPLVCCPGAPGQPAACYEHTDGAFRSCFGTEYAFPDGRTCCPLDGAAACATVEAAWAAVASSPGDAGAADAASSPAPGCSLPCPPGAFTSASIGFETGTPACSVGQLSTPGAACMFCCFDDGTGSPSCVSNACSCTGKYACDCFPACAACPAGWQPPTGGQFDLCCRPEADGTTSCFSQSSLVQLPASGG
ncbi:MAG TPA: hypothetical protein VKZ18_04535 [Polyangia bacterium]|nr:hypothetical protein [Polyangia bacterium]